MYTPVNPSFPIKQLGLVGSKLYRNVCVMVTKDIYQGGKGERLLRLFSPLKLFFIIICDYGNKLLNRRTEKKKQKKKKQKTKKKKKTNKNHMFYLYIPT